MRIVALSTAIISVGISFVQAQSTERIQRFEVASIKTVGPGQRVLSFACRGIDGTVPDKLTPADRAVPQGRCTGAYNLRFLAAYAYDMDVPNVSGGPTWATAPAGPAGGEFYLIEAAAENTASATRNDLRQMLQDLLRDRFKLKVHRETRQVHGYSLTLGKGGLKLKQSAADAKEQYTRSVDSASAMTVLAGNGSMAYIARTLAGILKGPVSDNTSTPGMFEFRLSYSLRQGESGLATVFTTVQDDLGLRLNSVSNVTVDFLIIDSAEKPVLDQR